MSRPPVPTPRPAARTLPALLDEIAARGPARPAIYFEDRCITYGELQGEARAVAKSLLALGVQRGDRVGAWLGNQPEWVAVCLGAAYVGATFVPLNTWYKSGEVSWTLAHCDIKVVVSASSFLRQSFAGILGELAPRLPALRAVVLLGDTAPGMLSWRDFLALGARTSDAALAQALAAVRPDDPAFILYTSGSTAEPKGVLLAHGGAVGNGYDMGQRRFVEPDDRVWIGSPLFYGLGATNALPVALTHGAAIVLQGVFDAGTAIETIARTQATVYYGTGNITRAIFEHPGYAQRKIGSLKKGNAGTMRDYKRMTLVDMGMSLASPAYGLTESYGNATVGWADDPLEAKLATSGHPLPGTELVVVDPKSGEPLPAGTVGLILLRGYTTPGYFRNPEETKRALRPDGFFDTGDLGSLDRGGRLVFHARLKEVIKSGGINVSPVEVEQLLARHPDVREAYVVGVPDAARGELIVAFVDAAAPLEPDALRRFVKEQAASFKVPHHVLFRTEAQLPRLASGKVSKARLVEEARAELGL